MTANQSSDCGWSTPRQYATFLAIVSSVLLLAVVFVRTWSPVAWEQPSFTPPSAYGEQPTMNAAALARAEASASVDVATANTDR